MARMKESIMEDVGFKLELKMARLLKGREKENAQITETIA